MIVIADTTPLNHLILIDQAHLLGALYGRVIVPQAVLSELQAQAAPQEVKAWISQRPDWLEVNRTSFAADSGLARLDRGEHDAILLAQTLAADLLLMDDPGGTTRSRPPAPQSCRYSYRPLPGCPPRPDTGLPRDP